jgi:phosphoglycerate kinase
MSSRSAPVASLLASSVDLDNAELQGKRVLYRVDLNLPLTQDHQVAEATRLTRILPTLQLLLRKGASVILCSHLGRPDPTTQALDEMRKEFSLAPVAQLLQQQLTPGTFTGLAADCIGPAAVQAVAALQPGQVWSVSETGC